MLSKSRIVGQRIAALAGLSVVSVLVGCSGGSDTSDSKTSDVSIRTTARIMAVTAVPDGWIAMPAAADPLFDNLAIPNDAPAKGMWSASKFWPLNAIHSILLPDGRVLTFGTPFGNPAAQDGRYFDLWDPSQGFVDAAHNRSDAPDPVNSFCGTATFLSNGQLMVSGGNGNNGKSSGLFTSTTNTAAASNWSLAAERWYATMLTLPDGRPLIMGGAVPYSAPVTSQTPEIYEGDAGWRSLFGAYSAVAFGQTRGNQTQANPWYYPRTWVAPSGKVFGITSDVMFELDPAANAGSGAIKIVGTFKTPQDSSGATTPNVGFTSTAVMYSPGKILQVGGNGVTDNNPNLASLQASIVDISGVTPVVTETSSMSNRRHWANATVLPDGKVAVTGGTTIGWDPANSVHPAEIWNPVTGAWTLGASNVETRTYHSSAILLPNGTVFTAGGGAPGAVNNLNAEIYYPPNLFTSVNGQAQLASRIQFSAISATKINHGGSVQLEMNDTRSVTSMALVATGSTTHSFNSTQRFVPVDFTQSGSRLTATMPAVNNAPPGYYMIFVVDANGVPSRGVIVGLGNVPAPSTVTATPTVSATTLPESSVYCAAEDGTCTIPGGKTATVYYGANGQYAVRKNQTGTISCSYTIFGDPLYGVVKSCYYVVQTAATLPSIAAPIIAAGDNAQYSPAVSIDGARYQWSFGDGSADTPPSSAVAAVHAFAQPGIYTVRLSATLSDGSIISKTFLQAVRSKVLTARMPKSSAALAVENRSNASARLWVVNPDNNSVSVLDTVSNALLAEISVGTSPRSVAIAPDGRVWVSNKSSATLSVINPATLTVVQTITLPRASQPHGIAFAPDGSAAYAVLEATGQLLKLNPATGAQLAVVNVGSNSRGVAVSADSGSVLISRFITPPLAGESTATVVTSGSGGMVVVVSAASMKVVDTVLLQYSDKADTDVQGSGIPNYLGAAVISPDGNSAWVPSKQDNIKRGTLRSGANLDFQNTVRAISSRIDMTSLKENYAGRIDHDNSSVASAAVFDPTGAYLFVALESSRQVAVVNATAAKELKKIDVGRAPQGLQISNDGKKLYVQNFMDRTVTVLDLSLLMNNGEMTIPTTATTSSITVEKLGSQALLGKQFFYDAKDVRLARDSYMSCASCHNDAAQDGRVWDMTGFGEGLRNTISLKGRGGTGHGFLHWTANFDEVQDFEKQIRNLSGGAGLMSDVQLSLGTRNQPLGDKKAGVSTDLDAMAAYLNSLDQFEPSPLRNADGTLTAAATAGKSVFQTQGCVSCHMGPNFTISTDANTLRNIGSIKSTSGGRLGGALSGIDVPTLRDVWATAPYFHDGSATSLNAAIQSHSGVSLSSTDLENLSQYLLQIGAEEVVVNLAQGKTARQSSTDFGGNATRATDGNTDGTYGNNSVTHTLTEAQPWWQVDLGQVATITQIKLWNRTDCCAERLQNVYVFVSANDMATRTLSQLTADTSVTTRQFTSIKAASQALQVGTIQGRYVRVQLGGTTILSLAEVQVFGVFPANLALGKSSKQSSLDWGGVASRGVDGITDGNYGNNSVTHTLSESQPWWQVDLGRDAIMNAVQLWNRTDCCIDRLQNVYVFVSSSDMTGRTLAQLTADPAVTVRQINSLNAAATVALQLNAVSGRYVRVQLGATGVLSLAEVQVYGTLTNNLSQGKATSQSSTDFAGAASRAVDGNLDGTYANNSVTHTQTGVQPWWQVDLSKVATINQIELWNRTDCCADRLKNIYVFVSANDMTGRTLAQLTADTSVTTQQLSSMNGAASALLQIPGVQGRYVRVQLSGSGDPLSLAEVRVYGQ